MKRLVGAMWYKTIQPWLKFLHLHVLPAWSVSRPHFAPFMDRILLDFVETLTNIVGGQYFDQVFPHLVGPVLMERWEVVGKSYADSEERMRLDRLMYELTGIFVD